MKFYDMDGFAWSTKFRQAKANTKILFNVGKNKAKEQKDRLQPKLDAIANKFKRKKNEGVTATVIRRQATVEEAVFRPAPDAAQTDEPVVEDTQE